MSTLVTLQSVDRRDPTPKYLQARNILVDAIRTGRLRPGAKLPSTADIGVMFDVSLITAHRAMEGLVEAGWLRREVGRGTYVNESIDLRYGARRGLSIGLVIDHHVNVDDYYHSTLLNGLRQAARGLDRSIDFFFDESFELQPKPHADVGAICIHPPAESRAKVEQLAQRVPTLVLGGAFPDSRLVTVDCDNEDGAAQAARHLIELGHRDVLIVSGPLNLSNSRDRVQGALGALGAQGMTLPRSRQLESGDAVLLDDRTRDRIARVLNGTKRPTAILAGGFYLALGLMQLARELEFEVPGDLSIVGFDDPVSAPLLDPPLTTVRQPLREMATVALRTMAAADGRPFGDVPSEQLATELIVRKSTAAVPTEPRP